MNHFLRTARYATFFIVLSLMACPATSAVEVEEGITYAKRGDRELKLDLAHEPGGKMRPAVLCIHGGGWAAGSRDDFRDYIERLAKQGFVAISAEYRLTNVAPWPAQGEDIRDAFGWIVEHADEYGIDAERIGVVGGSAGGHLALMLGLEPKEGSVGERVRAIVNIFGPTDMRKVETVEHVRNLVEGLVGGKLEDHLDVMEAASPIMYIDRTDPPVLTVHGTVDPIVQYFQAEWLEKALEKAQIPHQLMSLEGVGHGLGDEPEKVLKRSDEFLATYLKGPQMPLVAAENFTDDAKAWKVTDETAWKHVTKNGDGYFSLVKNKSDYEPPHRSPWNIALLQDVEVSDFVLDVDLRSTREPYGHQSLCLFFGYEDPAHFYYVHFGREADAHANSIFLVNDAPRVSIAQERTEGTDWSEGWHRARIRRDTQSGKIEVYMDDMTKPVMTTVDKTFGRGKIGIGSFDDSGDFDAIRLWGK